MIILVYGVVLVCLFFTLLLQLVLEIVYLKFVITSRFFEGIPIDQLNNDNQNCLDVAISMRQREVIRVLFSNENWPKLIRVNNKIEEDTPN